MKKQKNWLLESLVSAGYKATMPRILITEYLVKNKGLFCPLQVAKKLNKVDKVSIYRTIETLKTLELINPVINIDGQQFYEKNEVEHHHHHIICTGCKKTKCIDCEHAHIPKVSGFSNITHSLILTGVCAPCKRKL